MARGADGLYDPETKAFTEQGLQLLERAAGLGLSEENAAALFDITGKCLADRLRESPEATQAWRYGKGSADLQVSNSLYKKAVSGDVSAIKWYETTRQNRSEKVEQTVTQTSYVVEVPATMEEDEWTKRFSPNADPTAGGNAN